MTSIPFVGEILSLVAAILWALAIVLFKKSGESVHPLALNTFKNILASLLYLPSMMVAGVSLIQDFTAGEYMLLILSGAIGIALGDTLLFKSLNMIGAGPSALVNCLYSPFIIGLSFVCLGETLTVVQLVGAALIVFAVFEAARVKDGQAVEHRKRLFGVMWGVLGIVAMAVGVVMIKPLLDRAPLLWAVEVRLLGGVLALVVFVLLHPGRGRIMKTLLIKRSRGYTVSSSIIGGYIAMFCWLGGMKLTQASIASALNQTNTIFILMFAAVFLKEPITPGRVVAILAAIAGAMLVTFG